jgi:PAS domain S-box-containing protein
MNSPRAIRLNSKVRSIFDEHLRDLQCHTDRAFAWLLLGQWAFVIISAVTISPQAWKGSTSSIHSHVWYATILGGIIVAAPVAFIKLRPGAPLTRQIVALSQVMFSSLIIHLMGGRIEAHFHVFGSLAILSFYRDLKVFIPAILFIALDHMIRGHFWPYAVYGVATAPWWRGLEHTAWVVFESSFLLWGVAQSRRHLWDLACVQVELTEERDQLEENVEARVSEVKQQRLLLQNVINHLPAAVFWKDRELKYLGCNSAFAAIAGLQSPDEIIGKSDFDMPWTCEQSKGQRESDQQIIDQNRHQSNIEERLSDPTGRERTILTSKVPLLDVDNDVVGMIGIFQDISDRKLLEAQLAQAQKLESIGQLAAGIAHEINTPMQCVGGNVEFLKNCYERLFQVVDSYRAFLEGPDMGWNRRKTEMERLIVESRYDHLRTQAPAAIEEAADAVQRVIEIVRAMKAMSHPGTAAKVSTDINRLIQNAAAISKNRWKYGAEIEYQLTEPLPDVKALPAELSQVFLNLIVNASDAIVEKNGENSGALGRIAIRTRADGEGVLIEVEDDGNGIPEAIRQRIFDPFFTTKDVGKGTGQGLAITYDVIANKHGGVIQVGSSVGNGTTISIWLPCEPVTASTLRQIQSNALQHVN